jgi:hypothetical protein
LSEPSETPEQAVLRSEHRAYLEEGLTVLTDRERTALLLRDVEELPAELVAEQMLLQGDRALAHRQRAHQDEALHGAQPSRANQPGSRHEAVYEASRRQHKSRCLPAAIWDAGSAGASRGTSRAAPNAGTKSRLCAMRAAQLRELAAKCPSCRMV